MSLKIIKLDFPAGRLLLVLTVVLCVAAVWFVAKWTFASAVIARIDAARPEAQRPVAEWTTELAPDDPNTHFALAVLLEKSFEPGDLDRALAEYEKAAELSPHHYAIWLGLGKARSMNGDLEGAEAAFNRALELAPNYSPVLWTVGNFLIRQDRGDEGFALIARAAAADPKYSLPAVVTALQLYDGDMTRAKQILGDSENIEAALVDVHAGQGRFDEAFAAWSKLPVEKRLTKFKELTERLLGQFTEAKKFRLAAQLINEIGSDPTVRPMIGTIANGGFEEDIKLRDGKLFEWQIAEGSEPQIGRSDAQKTSGDHSLLMAFNTFATAGFREMEQTVVVEPGARYEFELAYRSDLKSTAILTWEVLDSVTTAPLTASPPLTPVGEWTRLKAVFAVPPQTDGVVIKLARTGCVGPTCPMSGRIWFDDLTLRRL